MDRALRKKDGSRPRKTGEDPASRGCAAVKVTVGLSRFKQHYTRLVLRGLRVFLAVLIVSASVVWGLLSLTVALEGFEDGRSVTVAGYRLEAEVAGALGLLLSALAILGAAWLLDSFRLPQFRQSIR